jgi:hypothetical protein
MHFFLLPAEPARWDSRGRPAVGMDIFPGTEKMFDLPDVFYIPDHVTEDLNEASIKRKAVV